MKRSWLFWWCGALAATAGEMPPKAASYHEALCKRPESLALFQRFRDAWLEERTAAELETELRARAAAGEAAAWAVLGREQQVMGREKAALEAFDKALAADPGAAWLSLERAKLLMEAGDFAKAEQVAMAVPEGDRLRAEALKLAGLASLRDQRVDAALEHWRQALTAAARDKGLLEELTELTRREGRLELALDFCSQWRDATDDAYGKAMATLQRAGLLFAAQRFDEAQAELGEVLKAAGDGSWLEREVLARAEEAHRQRGDLRGWTRQVGGWAEAYPARLGVQRAAANALAQTGAGEEALKILEQVQQRAPGEREIRWQRIDLLEKALKIGQAFTECQLLVKEEPGEAGGLRLAELAFRLERPQEVRRALDGVLAGADPAKAVGLSAFYARYGLPAEAERHWRELAGGEAGGAALRELGKHLQAAGREREALEAWRELGRRDAAADRIDAAFALSAAGERDAARELLDRQRERFADSPGYEVARAELAIQQGRKADAAAIYQALAQRAERADELVKAMNGWLGAVEQGQERALTALGESTGGRCLRAAWLAREERPLPAVQAGDALEREVRLALLRQYARWPEVVKLLETASGERSVVTLRELAEAKEAAGDLPGALAAVRLWRERMAEQPEAWLREAKLLRQTGDARGANALLSRANARFEDNEELARERLAGLYGEEAIDYAWQRYDRAAQPAAKAAWLRELTRLSSQSGDGLNRLEERLAERVRRDPGSTGPLLALADCARQKGQRDEELGWLQRALAVAPRDVGILAALASLEERTRGAEATLPRYAEIARLQPGPEAALSWAEAKIRSGRTREGLQDLQRLAGDRGLDLGAVESGAAELVSRGWIEEAIEFLSAVPEASRDARRSYALGILLEADGREREALDCYAKVLQEPDDPAETSRSMMAYEDWMPFRGRGEWSGLLLSGTRWAREENQELMTLSMPASLIQAKREVNQRLFRLAFMQGGEIWQRAGGMGASFGRFSREEWAQALDFFADREGDLNGWEFFARQPDSALALALLQDFRQASEATPEQAAALLQSGKPLQPEMSLALMARLNQLPADLAERFAAVPAAAWRDPQVAVAGQTNLVRWLGEEENAEKPPGADTLAALRAAIGAMEAGDLLETFRLPLQLCRARVQFLEGDAEAAVRTIDTAMAGVNESERSPGFPNLPLIENFCGNALRRWAAGKGEAERAKLEKVASSPVVRVTLALASGGTQVAEKAARELAALPADAAPWMRRQLVRLSRRAEGGAPPEVRRKSLEAAVADDADPVLAMEALLQLQSLENSELPVQGDRGERYRALLKALEGSDPEAHRLLEALDGERRMNAFRAAVAAPSTRWGAARTQSPRYDDSRNRERIERLTKLEDRAQAVRELAAVLEEEARRPGMARQIGSLLQSFERVPERGEAVRSISLPEGAGLRRRAALARLYQAAGLPAEMREVLARIHRERPWDAKWSLRLGFATEDPAEAARLFDLAAQSPVFGEVLIQELFLDPTGARGEALLGELERLAPWAESRKGPREWLGTIVLGLLGGSTTGLQSLEEGVERPQRPVFGRYAQMALDDARTAELAFRAMETAGGFEPQALQDAARRVLLAGAYREAGPRNFRTQPFPAPEATAALDFLVTAARGQGEAKVFPPAFRSELAAVDPALAAWLDRLLAARVAKELPELLETGFSRCWQDEVRHRTAARRAAVLPGREELLQEVFRRTHPQSPALNFTPAVAASLQEARRQGSLTKRTQQLLEAASGPMKNWPRLEPLQANALQQNVALLMKAAADTDMATTMELMIWLVEKEVDAGYGGSSGEFMELWQREPLEALTKIPAAKLLRTGYWARQGVVQAKPAKAYRWAVPDVLASRPEANPKEFRDRVLANPSASLAELLMVMARSERSFEVRIRILRQFAGEIQKLPAAMRQSVIGTLTAPMQARDLERLPAFAAPVLRDHLEAARAQRIAEAHRQFEQVRNQPTARAANYAYPIGLILGDDPKLAGQWTDEWLAATGGASMRVDELRSFVQSILLSGNRPSGDGVALLEALKLIDRFAQDRWPELLSIRSGTALDSAVGATLNSSEDAPMAGLGDPKFWRTAATLPPALQARLFAAVLGSRERWAYLAKSPRGALVEAAKGSEVTRTALAWLYGMAAWEPKSDDEASPLQAETLVDFLRALKKAGLTAAEFDPVMKNAYRSLTALRDPERLMKETPALLEDVKTLDPETAATLLQRLGNWCSQRKYAMKKQGAPAPEIQEAPAEAVALVKAVLPKTGGRSQEGYSFRELNSLVLASGDDALLENWLNFAGSELRGDPAMVLGALRRGKPEMALALAGPGSLRIGSEMFDATLESQVAKLQALGTPQAKLLALRVSLLGDDRRQPPQEPLAQRRQRLLEDFDQNGAALPETQRIATMIALGRHRRAAFAHQPELDAFAGEALKERLRLLKTSQGRSRESQESLEFTVAVVCSQLHADDASGLAALAGALKRPAQPEMKMAMLNTPWMPMLLAACWIHTDRHDGRLPEPSRQAMRELLKLFGGDGDDSRLSADVAMLAYLISGSPEEAAGELKALKLGPELRFPSESLVYYFQLAGRWTPAETQLVHAAIVRMSVLHPAADEAWRRRADGRPRGPSLSPLPLLADAKVRAAVSPARTLRWMAESRGEKEEVLELLRKFRQEREADFSEEDKLRWEPTLANLQRRLPLKEGVQEDDPFGRPERRVRPEGGPAPR